eukprot:8915635-Pyramimonas_sp.AAC.1
MQGLQASRPRCASITCLLPPPPPSSLLSPPPHSPHPFPPPPSPPSPPPPPSPPLPFFRCNANATQCMMRACATSWWHTAVYTIYNVCMPHVR